MTTLFATVDKFPRVASVMAVGGRRSFAGLVATLLPALLLLAAAARAHEPMPNVSIYAGSRGTGVPEAARARLLEIERFLTSEQASAPGAFRFGRSVVGLEGETMLCIAFQDAAKRELLLARLQPMVASVPLLNVGRSNCSVD